MKLDLQFSVLCDDLRREDNGKFILIGLFEAVAGLQFPMTYPSLCVVNRWCNGEGKFSQRIRLVSSGNEKIAETEDSPVHLPATLANVTSVSIFRNVSFPLPGRYWVEVLLDGDLKQRYPLMALQIQAQPGQAGGPPGLGPDGPQPFK
jgi:hypothetical protein